MKKKILSLCLAMLMALTVFTPNTVTVVKADTTVTATPIFEEMKVTVLDDLRNYDQKVGLSWQLNWALNEDAGITEQVRYGKFTIKEKSYVHIKMSILNEEAFAANEYFRIYANDSMAVPILEDTIDFGNGDDYLLLNPGTYYVECGTKLYLSGKSNHSTKVMIGAIPEKDAVKVTKTVAKDCKSVTVSVEQKITSDLFYYHYKKGIESSTYIAATLGTKINPSTNSFTVTENDTYTIAITTGGNNRLDIVKYVNVNEIGAKLKKGTTYKVRNLKYKVVKNELNGAGTVMVAGVVKQKKSVVIPKTVKINGHKYTVVKINKNAFKNKNKIKTITIKSKAITSIGKNAFKGINKKAVIKVPKDKYSTYKKLIKSKTGYKKTMKIKK